MEREMCVSSRTLVECMVPYVVPYDYKAEKRGRKGGSERSEGKEKECVLSDNVWFLMTTNLMRQV